MKKRNFSQISEKMAESRDYTIFVVGDSITEGARATDDEHTYTAVFARGLAERFPDRTVIRYDGKRHPVKNAELLGIEHYEGPITVHEGGDDSLTVIRCGIGGNSAQRLLNRKADFIRNAVCPTPDLYIIMLGINDSISVNPAKYVTPDVFAQNLALLTKELTDAAPNADLIFMTPTYNDRGISTASTVAPYANAMRNFCAQEQLALIDQHRLWMDHLIVGGENYGQGDWLCGMEGDHCHPGDVGHAAIANEMLTRLFEDAQ